MKATFVDTGVWYALFDSADSLHASAQGVLSRDSLPFVTCWPVIWEVVTLIGRRHGGTRAAKIGRELITARWARIVDLTTIVHVLALQLLEKFDSLKLSAADALSCAVIRRLNISQVASFDKHFTLLLPERLVFPEA